MLKMLKMAHRTSRHQQYGAAAVEFALIAMLFFTLLFGILEFGRLFYIYNTVQEVTRRAAREAVVNNINETDSNPAKGLALFGGTSLPAGVEIKVANIKIEYLNASGVPLTGTSLPGNAEENLSACLVGPAGCITFVRVSITGATYAPMVGLFTFFSVPIPASTVTMPAESLGYGS